MNNCLSLLIFNHICHKKKKKDHFLIYFAESLFNVTDRFLLNLKTEKYYDIYLIRIIYKTYEDYKSHINSK